GKRLESAAAVPHRGHSATVHAPRERPIAGIRAFGPVDGAKVLGDRSLVGRAGWGRRRWIACPSRRRDGRAAPRRLFLASAAIGDHEVAMTGDLAQEMAGAETVVAAGAV